MQFTASVDILAAVLVIGGGPEGFGLGDHEGGARGRPSAVPGLCRPRRRGPAGFVDCCARAGFLGGAFGVEGEEAGEHLVTDGVRPAVAVRLLLPAPGGFVDFVVEEEVTVGGACQSTRRRRGRPGPWLRAVRGA